MHVLDLTNSLWITRAVKNIQRKLLARNSQFVSRFLPIIKFVKQRNFTFIQIYRLKRSCPFSSFCQLPCRGSLVWYWRKANDGNQSARPRSKGRPSVSRWFSRTKYCPGRPRRSIVSSLARLSPRATRSARNYPFVVSAPRQVERISSSCVQHSTYDD